MGYDALATMPETLKSWADKKGLQSFVKRYGWSFCEVCGLIGIPWTTDWLPEGFNLEFEVKRYGWMHPPTNVMSADFGDSWSAEKEPEKLGDRDRSYFFNLFMKSLVNSWGLGPENRHGKGVTNPWDFCFSNMVSFGKRRGGEKGVCPKCGEPGTGEGVVEDERRFFHEPGRSCYLGMVEPKRIKRPETICPKCKELGRESLSKGHRYFRHKTETCYVKGKISDHFALQQVEPSEGKATKV